MARPKLHNIDIWPWVVSRYTWQLVAEYDADPPMFTRDWRPPLIPLTGDGQVGARSRCGKLLPIHRFAPSNETVSCKSCIYQITFGMETDRGVLGETPIEELPAELQYLHICPTAACSAILGPEDHRCQDCTVALADGLPI